MVTRTTSHSETVYSERKRYGEGVSSVPFTQNYRGVTGREHLKKEERLSVFVPGPTTALGLTPVVVGPLGEATGGLGGFAAPSITRTLLE